LGFVLFKGVTGGLRRLLAERLRREGTDSRSVTAVRKRRGRVRDDTRLVISGYKILVMKLTLPLLLLKAAATNCTSKIDPLLAFPPRGMTILVGSLFSC
jgi:hypothetical protein